VTAVRLRIGMILLAAALAACAAFKPRDRSAEIPSAVAALAAAGFSFPVDIRIVHDPMAVCDGITCADLVVIDERRTIRLANHAFTNPSKLRASLLEIWPRYERPKRGNLPDLARGALLVVTDGARVGISDAEVTREARFAYRQLWNQLKPAERAGLPTPDSLFGDGP
jgi:hypothetical protein